MIERRLRPLFDRLIEIGAALDLWPLRAGMRTPADLGVELPDWPGAWPDLEAPRRAGSTAVD